MQKRRRAFPIKYKILILLTLIPLVTLSAYLVMAVRVFEKDKIAYVFDSSAAVSSTVASQVRSELSAILTTNKPLIQDFLNFRTFGELSKSIFNNQPDLDLAIALLPDSTSPSGFKAVSILEKEADSGAQFFSSIKDVTLMLSKAESSGRLILNPMGDDRILIIERLGKRGSPDFSMIMLLSRIRSLVDVFQTVGSYKLYLTTQDGSTLIGPEEERGVSLNEIIAVDFSEMIGGGKTASGTREIENSDNKPILVSFSQVGIGDLIVTATVEKEHALRAVQTLLRKSLLFFGVLLSGTAIISLIASGTLTSALSDLYRATRRVAEGYFDIRVQVTSSDEVGILAENFNLMAAEVQRLMMETAEKARMEGELKTAQTVQETLFPESNAKFGSLAISGYYEPASECGGDWWHYCKVGKKVFLWIGDATGHGAPAALITSAARSASTIIERLNVTPAQALSLLNRAIYDVSKGQIMMTFFVASYDPDSHEFTYANASHEPPYLVKGSVASIKKRDLVPLNEVNNPRLGQDRDTKYEQTSLLLEKGDTVIFFTDGIPDVQSPQNILWGEREFIKTIVESFKDHPTPSLAVNRVIDKLQSFRLGTQLKDDITFFCCKNEGEV